MDDMMFNKNSGGVSGFNELTSMYNKTVYIAQVIDISDDADALRIKVRIPSIDDTITDNSNLPYCNPILPKFLNIVPQVGEAVIVFVTNPRFPFNGRLWLGSVISQWENIAKDDYNNKALNGTDYSSSKLEKGINTIPEARGVFPDKEDIGIVGRVNTDVILKPNQVIIRAGKHEDNNVKKLNKTNPAYLNVKFNPNKKTTYSITVSDKNYLLSHKGNKLPNAILTDSDIDNLDNITEPLPYGNKLVSILNLIIEILTNHTHPYHDMSILALDAKMSPKLSEAKRILGTLLSENNRIN